jgi:fido (protein-threonine AMPylation protein)/biotin operon repressor
LFQGIYSHAGKIRDYNITKHELVLNGETVLYASAESLKSTLEYDFRQEKVFSYIGLSQHGIIEHLAQFVSYLWQIHIFGEGNTRTTAVFLIKYLRKLGFNEVNNDLFAEHSWYFRNALVRANYEDLSKGIHKTDKYLISFLLNLIHHENHLLKNREMHVQFVEPVNDPVKANNDPVNDLVNNAVKRNIMQHLKQNPKANYSELADKTGYSTATIKRHIQELKKTGIIERIGSDKTGYWKIIEQ